MSESETYHPYVFDVAARRFIGHFDDMYRAELRLGFDSWHQDDLSNLTKRICMEVFASHHFERVLDVGCGKGAFTQQLIRENNRVVGIDLSRTALEIARTRCPGATFIEANVDEADLSAIVGDGFDLVVCLETLSYLKHWEAVLDQFASVGRHALVALYLPENPIGYVKSFGDLDAAFARSFARIEDIRLSLRRQVVLFGGALPRSDRGRDAGL